MSQLIASKPYTSHSVSAKKDTANTIISSRCFPSHHGYMRSRLQFAGMETRCNYVDPAKNASQQHELLREFDLPNLAPHDTAFQFWPASHAPFQGYASNVDVENELKFQYFAQQRDDRQVYVPHSRSDLYTNIGMHPVQKQTTNCIGMHSRPYLATQPVMLFNNNSKAKKEYV